MLVDVLDRSAEKVFVSKDERLSGNSSSIGNQIKWKHGSKFIKLNAQGYEDIAEVMVSNLLYFTNLQKHEFVMYYSCVIYEDGICLGNGCYSYDFVGDSTEVTVADILNDNLLPYSISYDELRLVLLDVVGFDCKRYIDKILCVDAITRNEDRHFKNISFLNKDGRFVPAPIFDNGDSCLSDTISHPLDVSFAENIKACYAKPFRSKYLENLVDTTPLVIDYQGFMDSMQLSDDRSIRAFVSIMYGLKETEGIAWVRK